MPHARMSSFARLTFVATVLMAAVSVTSAAAQPDPNPTLQLVTVTPADPSVEVGAQAPLVATGSFDDATTRQLGGGGARPQWHVLFGPGLAAPAACGSTPPGGLCCQGFEPTVAGTFEEDWSNPPLVHAVGQFTTAALSAALSCAAGGEGTGTLEATWNGTHYAGTYTFANSGSVLVKGLTWSSSDAAVATVDDTGTVHGVAEGTATITATFASTCWPGTPEPSGGCDGTVVGTTTVTVVLATAPTAPTELAADVNGNLVRFRWTPPQSGPPPTGYELIGRATEGGPVLAVLPLGPLGPNPFVVLEIPNGSFFVTVRATSAGGGGPESAGVPVAVPGPPSAPGAPTNLTSTVNGNTVTFSWMPPNVPNTSFILVAALTPGGAPIATLPLPASQIGLVVGSVPPGTYHVRVFAVNDVGTSPPSNEVTFTVAAPQPPDTPAMNEAVVEGSTVTLSWVPAPTGGAATSHELAVSLTSGGPPALTLPIGATGLTVPAAPSGTFFLRVRAVNAAGTSAFSNEISVTIP